MVIVNLEELIQELVVTFLTTSAISVRREELRYSSRVQFHGWLKPTQTCCFAENGVFFPLLGVRFCFAYFVSFTGHAFLFTYYQDFSDHLFHLLSFQK